MQWSASGAPRDMNRDGRAGTRTTIANVYFRHAAPSELERAGLPAFLGLRTVLVGDPFAMTSMVDVRRLIREYGWAVLVTAAGGTLQAAHVPCLLDRDRDLGGDAEQLVIVGHTARADPVSAALIAGNESLLIFQGAHGYVSPAWYGDGIYLPTWNFTAVHVAGIPEPLEGKEAFSVLERTVEHFEVARDDPWKLQGDALEYARRIATGTCPFRLRSVTVRAKAKLSQDKSREIQQRVVSALGEPGPYQNPSLASAMAAVITPGAASNSRRAD
jgi:transcriptional regulator